MTEKKRYYFGYGLWLDVKGMERKGATFVGAGALNGWALKERGYADISPEEGGVVHGAVYEVDENVENSLDCAEGYPSFYGKDDVKVQTVDGEFEVFVYVMAEEFTKGRDGMTFSEGYAIGNAKNAKRNGIPVDPLYAKYLQICEVCGSDESIYRFVEVDGVLTCTSCRMQKMFRKGDISCADCSNTGASRVKEEGNLDCQVCVDGSEWFDCD